MERPTYSCQHANMNIPQSGPHRLGLTIAGAHLDLTGQLVFRVCLTGRECARSLSSAAANIWTNISWCWHQYYKLAKIRLRSVCAKRADSCTQIYGQEKLNQVSIIQL